MTNRPPIIDHHRRMLSIPRRLMPTLLAVHAGTPPHSAATTELRDSGLIASQRLDPLVKSLIDVMTDPTLVVSVEVNQVAETTAPNPRLATIWRRGSRAVIGITQDRNQFDLVHVEPDLLPFHIAQTINLTPRRQPTFTGSLRIPAQVLTRSEDLITKDPTRADSELAAAGVPRHWADRLVAALLLRRSLWVVESVWSGNTPGKEESRLCVLDGGFSGYWRLGATADGLISVSPTGFDELMNRLDGLLP